MAKSIFILLLFILLSTSLSWGQSQPFTKSDLKNVNVSNPTSLQFGPDGRLYVAQQNGTLKAINILRNGSEDYVATDVETINAIKVITNHNDDGTIHDGELKRQVTSILVVGTAENPIIYVGSSDYRIGAGTQKGDVNLDTNSGMISRLTWTGVSWDRIDLIRGLPRSEENHANNGMQLDEVNNILYVASGGNTNSGGPSNNFAFITEYALSAAILAVDMDVVDKLPIHTDQRTGEKFVYDLATLDDPTRENIDNTHPLFPYEANHPLYNTTIDLGDPFGGNDGLNQAKVVENSPVQIYSPGFRNIYDLVLTEDGRLYTWDNGANGGWGGHPDQEGGGNVTNNLLPDASKSGPMKAGWAGEDEVVDGNVNNKDGLHFVGYTSGFNPFAINADPKEAYYGGHPTPIRANPGGAGLFTHDVSEGGNNADIGGFWRTELTNEVTTTLPTDWPPVPLSMANPIEGDFRNAGVDDPSIWSFEGMSSYSTNGIALYTASNFDGALQNHLLAASYNNKIYQVKFNDQGGIDNPRVNIDENPDIEVFGENFGNTPLDVIAQGDNDIFPGSVWACSYVSNNITVFEPNDFLNCISPGDADYDPAADYDSDGYINSDEIVAGTDICNAASTPSDNDQDFISDIKDTDDDNDGIADLQDLFQLDPDNGESTLLPINYPLLNGDPATGIAGLGFTGLMANGQDYLDLIQDKTNSDIIVLYGGAPGQLGIGGLPGEGIPENDALGDINSQINAFQFGVDVNSGTPPFTVEVDLVGPIFESVPEDNQSAGFYIGTGDQDNYIKIAVNANGGTGGIEVVEENEGISQQTQYEVAGILTSSAVNLFLSVNPQSGSVQPKYSLDGGQFLNLGDPIVVKDQILSSIKEAPALAVGVIATSRGASSSSQFSVSWDNININYDESSATGTWQLLADSEGSPAVRHENAYVQAGNKFYLLGGRDSNNKKVDIYDPVANAWSASVSEPPVSLHHFQAVEYKGLIYIMGAFTGGYPGEVPVENIYIYNPANDTWHVGPEIPRPRGSAGVVVYEDKIYMAGGLQDGHRGDYVAWFDEYDPRNKSWKEMPDLPKYRDHFHAALIQDKLVLAGGRLSDANGNIKSENHPEELLPILPSGNTNVFNVVMPDVNIFNFKNNSWDLSAKPEIPTPRAGASAGVIGDEVIIIGGESAQADAHKEVEAYDIYTNSWRSLSTMLPEQSGEVLGRHGTQAIVSNNAIYIAAGSGKRGGSPELSSQQVFYPYSETVPDQPALNISDIELSASNLNFGDVNIGDSKSLTLNVKNTGSNQGIDIYQTEFTGSDAFQLLATPESTFIPAGESIDFKFVFTSKSTEEADNLAEFSISHSAVTEPVVIALSANENQLNEDPSVISPIADLSIEKGASITSINLAEVFNDNEDTSDQLTYSVQTNNDLLLSAEIVNNILNIDLNAAEIGSAKIIITATDSEGATAEESFFIQVYDPDFLTIYRENVGGNEISGQTTDEQDWVSDTDNNPSQYRDGGKTYSTTDPVTLSPSVPEGTPLEIFQSERYWDTSVEGTTLNWSIPAAADKPLEVRVYFAEIFLEAEGEKRVFDMFIDNQLVEDNLNIYAEVGHDVGMMRSYQIISDGMVDISFDPNVENPAVKGIEILAQPAQNILTVDAGVDQKISNNLPTDATLTASVSNPDTEFSVNWTQKEGPSTATITNADQLIANVSDLIAGTYIFELTVTDEYSNESSDQVKIEVYDPAQDCPAEFVEENGIAIIEAESAGFIPSGWTKENAIDGYTGDAYLRWTGSDNFSNPGIGTLTYKVYISKPGTYRVQWRNRIAKGDLNTEHNDAWLRFPDASDYYGEESGSIVYPKGSGKTPVPEGSGKDGWFKIYTNELNRWSWQTKTSDNDPHLIFAEFDQAGVYTIEISGRSNGHAIDRIALSHSTIKSSDARDINIDQTVCELPEPVANQLPTVELGDDITIQLPDDELTLTAEASDSDGSIESYSWTQIGGPGDATFSSTSDQEIIVTGLVEGIYTFEVTVTDDDGDSAKDEVNVDVLKAPDTGTDPVSLTLEALHDAYLQDGTRYNNSELRVESGRRETYLMFDLSEVAGTVTGATLEMTIASDPGDGKISVAIGEHSNWTETTLTTSNSPSPVSSSGSITGSYSRGVKYVIDLSGIEAGGMLTLIVTHGSGNDVAFASSENATALARPTLQLEVNGDSEELPEPVANQLPTVELGDDITIQLPDDELTLTAEASDSDGSIESYSWTQIGGPGDATFSSTSDQEIIVTGLVEGIYTFEVRVTDDDGDSAKDEVNVDVLKAPDTGTDPVSLTLEALHDAYLQDGTRYNNSELRVESGRRETYLMFDLSEVAGTVTGATLEMTIASDPGNGEVSVAIGEHSNWTETTLTTSNSPSPVSSSGSITGSYSRGVKYVIDLSGIEAGGMLTLIVTHGSGNDVAFASSENATALARPTLQLEVNGDSEELPEPVANQLPTVELGDDITIQLPDDELTLTAEASDSDGSIESYSWTQIGGPGDATFSSTSNQEIIVTGLVEGIYTFEVRVTDDDGDSAKDEVNVDVLKAPDTGTDPVSLTLEALHDAYLQDGTRYNNSELRVESGRRETYLMFDLSEVAGTVTGATLEMTIASDPGNGEVSVAIGEHSNWTETTLTTSNSPSPVSSSGSITGSYSRGVKYVIDLSGIEAGGMLTLIVTHGSGNDVAFASSENATASARPKLIIFSESSFSSISKSPKSAKLSEHTTSNFDNIEIGNTPFEITLYPNPVIDFITIDLDEEADFILMNEIGAKLKMGSLDKGTNKLDMSNLRSGLYIIKLSLESSSEFRKLIKY